MINCTLAMGVHQEGRDLWRTISGSHGYVVYGPYVSKTHGVYQVDFELALAVDAGDSDTACAVLEITGDNGNIILAERTLRTTDLSTQLRRFSLLAVLRQIHRLEFRIAATGSTELVVDAEPRLTRIAGILDEPPHDDLGMLADDLGQFAKDTRRILRNLRPYDLQGFDKIRMGKDADGGYVCIDDFSGIDTAFSLGINDDISWDLDAAGRGLTVYQFDHTVADPAPNDARMIFEPKRIGPMSGPDTQALGDLIRRHDKGATRPNLILKMDIENSEWEVLDATPVEELTRIAWIVCELHYFQGLAEREHRALMDRVLRKLASVFVVFHVHSNVWGGYSSFGNTVVPNVVEVSFANRSCYALKKPSEMIQSPLDQSCDSEQPDFYIGSFAF